MSIKIIHAADFHLDSPFDALPDSKAIQRRQELRQQLLRLSELISRERAELVLLSGDLFDSSLSYHETCETLLQVLSGISAQIFISPGNHDYYCPKSPYHHLRFPENVHIFSSPTPRGVLLPELSVKVWGAGFNASLCPPLLRGFSVPEADRAYINIMVLHGALGGETYNPITEQEIAESGLDYLALGHVHTFSGIQRAGNTFYAYPGCIEGRGFDETGPKGVISGTVSKGSCALQFLPINLREYKTVTVDLTGKSDLPAAVRAAAEGDGRDIIKLVLTGEYSGKIDSEQLCAALADRFFHVKVQNRTVLPRDIWDSLEEDTLKGIFLQKMRTAYNGETDEDQRDKLMSAIRYGLAALENREEWIS